MAITGKSEIRVDAFDKATGRTKYYDDLAPSDALIVRVKHSPIAPHRAAKRKVIPEPCHAFSLH